MQTRRINGEAVKTFREIRGYSATEIAAALGVNVSTISRIESGGRQLSPKNVQALADVLQVNAFAFTYPVAA